MMIYLTKIMFTRATSTILAILLTGTLPLSAETPGFGEFLEESVEAASFTDSEESAARLEEAVTSSAKASGKKTKEAQYRRYARKLAKTLGKLNSSQQYRIFTKK